MGWCPAGGRLWKVPVQEQAHLCKMALGSISRQGDKEHPANPVCAELIPLRAVVLEMAVQPEPRG